MRIGILGTRGVPANYGGFETFAEELGSRLAARGHDVTIYGRRHYVPAGLRAHRGTRLVILPTIRHKYLDTIVHTLVSTIHALIQGYDVVLLCNAANAIFAVWPRVVGTRVVLNVDGLERNRRKWNAIGRAWYLLSEYLATMCPDAIVTDARVIQEYYRDRHRVNSTFIPYGSDLEPVHSTDVLSRFGLQPGQYFLYVSRLEPENNAHAVIAGFEQAGLDHRLVIVGDAPYAQRYIESLRRAAGPLVTFTGAIYGDGYRALQTHALAYIHATEVGGTHPALVEAMGFGRCIVVNDVPENREVAGDAARYFTAADPGSLADALRWILAEPRCATQLGCEARARARRLFSWDAITQQYEQLFEHLVHPTPEAP